MEFRYSVADTNLVELFLVVICLGQIRMLRFDVHVPMYMHVSMTLGFQKTMCRTRRELIQEEVQRLLAQEDNWHLDDSTPSNMINVSDPKHAKAVIQETDEESIVVLSFYAPHCRACRAMWTAKKKIAETNPDVVFVEVNTNISSLATMAENLGVSRQPWFIILSGGTAEEVSSFTANLQTIDRLRAEIAATKECTGECLEANT